MRKPKLQIPTDLAILETTFNKYREEYLQYDKTNKTRSSKIYVPIKCEEIAKSLNTDEDIIFGRYYFYLDQKYRYKQEDGSSVHLFALAVGKDLHAINFVMLTSILAGLREDDSRNKMNTVLSIAAIIISVIASALSVGG